MKYVSPGVGLLLFWCMPLGAADYQGAAAVLKQLTEERHKAGDAAKPANPMDELRTKLAAYRAEVAALPPEQAAERWLALFDTFSILPAEVLNNPMDLGLNRLSTQSFLQDLPPSAAWPTLAKAIETRAESRHDVRDGGLRILAAMLRGDSAGRNRAFEALGKSIDAAKLEDFAKENFHRQVEMIAETLVALDGTDEERLALFEKQLTQAENPTNPSRFTGMGQITVPDLVGLAGR